MLKIISKNILVIFVIVVMCSFQLEKKLLAESIDSSNDNSSIYFEADNLYYDNDGNNITAEGNAKLFYKTYVVEANKITYIQDIWTCTRFHGVISSRKMWEDTQGHTSKQHLQYYSCQMAAIYLYSSSL